MEQQRQAVDDQSGQAFARLRWLGALPLIFFAARVVEYVWIARTPEQILWCCHISNLLLGLGLLFHHRRSVRIAALWILVGLPPWALDMVLTGLITPVSLLSHLGGAVIALVALRRVGVSGRDWLPALVYFLLLQQLTRLLTVRTADQCQCRPFCLRSLEGSDHHLLALYHRQLDPRRAPSAHSRAPPAHDLPGAPSPAGC